MEDWEDVLDNKEILRKIITEGTGEKPQSGQVVIICIAAEGEKPVSIRCPLNKGFLPDLFEITVMLMKEGGESEVKTTERFQVDTFSFDDKIIEGSRHYNLRLVSYEGEGEFSENEFVKVAHKRGNDYFKGNETGKALIMYNYCVDNGEDEVEKFTYLSNICACHQKEQEWDQLIKASDNLEIPEEVSDLVVAKLLYRRGTALQKRKRYEEALTAFEEALEKDPENKHIMDQVNQTKDAAKRELIKQKKFYKAMMNNIYKKDPKVTLKKMTFPIVISVVVVLLLAILFSYYDLLITSD